MAFCTNCGAKLQDGSKFCSACGYQQAQASAQPPASEPQQSYTPEPQQSYNPPVVNNYTPEPQQSYNPPVMSYTPEPQQQNSYTPPAAQQNYASEVQQGYNAAPQQPNNYTPAPVPTRPQGGAKQQKKSSNTVLYIVGGIALAAVIAVLLLVLLGGKGGAGSNGGGASDPALGTYEAITASMFGIEMDAEDVFEDGFSIMLKAGGKCTLDAEGSTIDGEWVLEGKDLTISAGGVDCTGTLDGDKLTIENLLDMGATLYFDKVD